MITIPKSFQIRHKPRAGMFCRSQWEVEYLSSTKRHQETETRSSQETFFSLASVGMTNTKRLKIPRGTAGRVLFMT